VTPQAVVVGSLPATGGLRHPIRRNVKNRISPAAADVPRDLESLWQSPLSSAIDAVLRDGDCSWKALAFAAIPPSFFLARRVVCRHAMSLSTVHTANVEYLCLRCGRGVFGDFRGLNPW
jgi:hypothetical protein